MATLITQFIPRDVANRKDLDIRTGDTVKVSIKIEEKGKVRIQAFEGLVIARKHGTEAGGTFTVRKISHGVGVERIFPLYSPSLEKIEVLRRTRVRKSKLYFIREKVTRDIRRKMRNFVGFFASTSDLAQPEDMMEEVVEEVIDTAATPETIETTEVSAE